MNNMHLDLYNLEFVKARGVNSSPILYYMIVAAMMLTLIVSPRSIRASEFSNMSFPFSTEFVENSPLTIPSQLEGVIEADCFITSVSWLCAAGGHLAALFNKNATAMNQQEEKEHELRVAAFLHEQEQMPLDKKNRASVEAAKKAGLSFLTNEKQVKHKPNLEGLEAHIVEQPALKAQRQQGMPGLGNEVFERLMPIIIASRYPKREVLAFLWLIKHPIYFAQNLEQLGAQCGVGKGAMSARVNKLANDLGIPAPTSEETKAKYRHANKRKEKQS